MAFDQKSYDLAVHFLQDEPQRIADPEKLKAHASSLAQHIQTAIEDWFSDWKRPEPTIKFEDIPRGGAAGWPQDE